MRFVIFPLSLLFFCFGVACSGAPVEDDEPAPPPEVTEEELQMSIDTYISDCHKMCEQTDRCADDDPATRYPIDDCIDDCDANRQVLQMDIDDVAGMKSCFDAYVGYGECVLELDCEGWQKWQEHRGNPDAPDYPCRALTERAHRACYAFAEELQATLEDDDETAGQ